MLLRSKKKPCAADVDAMMSRIKDDYEQCLGQQKERLLALRDENRALLAAIQQYKDNERYIVGAIQRAEEIAKTIILDAERKAKERLAHAESENKRLKALAADCYQRLLRLRHASEAIYKLTSREVHMEEAGGAPSRPRPIISLYDGQHR